jgi:Protein of unknown function (DUF2889)
MPLSAPPARHEIHHRVLDMRAYARDDGLFDVEVHLVDRKPFDFQRDSAPDPIPAGQALHDLWVRMTVDGDYTVRAIEAASDVTPWAVCKQAEATLSVLVGERLVRGWSAKVKERLRGAASCTHLMEMLLPAATTALQGIRGLSSERRMAVDAQGVPLKLDSCYAYSREREVVLKLWPQHHRPAARRAD